MKNDVRTKSLQMIYIALGVFLVAFAVNMFLAPHYIAAGGATGIGIILFSLFNFDVFLVVTLINVLVLALAYIFLGRQVFLKSLYGSILLPLLLRYIPVSGLLQDRLLSVIVGSIIFGCGVSLLYHNEGSSGGTTIPPLIFSKYFNINKSIGLLLTDSIIVIFSLFSLGAESFVLAVISIFLTSVTMNYIVSGINPRLLLTIVSKDKHEIIREKLHIKNMKGFLHISSLEQSCDYNSSTIMVSIKKNEHQALIRYVESIDPQSFVIVQSIKHIHGQVSLNTKDLQEAQ